MYRQPGGTNKLKQLNVRQRRAALDGVIHKNCRSYFDSLNVRGQYVSYHISEQDVLSCNVCNKSTFFVYLSY